MNAQKHVDGLHKNGDVLRRASFGEHGWCNGRGMAIVIDGKESMAIMLENCGQTAVTNIRQGAIVKFATCDGGETRITGSPGYC